MTAQESDPQTSAFARFLTRALPLASRHLWVWPLLGALVLVVVSLWVRGRIETVTRAELSARLQTLLNADIAALRSWFSERDSDAKSFTADPRVRAAILDLLTIARPPDADASKLVDSSPADSLRAFLRPLLQSQNYVDYLVIGKDRRILASLNTNLVGQVCPRTFDVFLRRALDGQPVVSRPFEPSRNPTQRIEEPTMFVGAPVRGDNEEVVAVLALRMRPEEEFSRLFSLARLGDSGEAYAFDRQGYLLTATRFDEELKNLGLIPRKAGATSILNLRLLDPEVNLDEGQTSTKPRDQLQLTKMATAAIKGWQGFDVQGYRNYRGVKVVGAWAWLPQHGMGVATEVSVDEAFQTLYLLRQAFMVLFILLMLSGAAIFGLTLFFERLQASIRKSAAAARRVGPYVLVEEIGRGTSGMVYRARHELLRRPVAIKLLSPDMTNETTAARFEHEVQMTSQLTHPNTVAIYDYGRTPEGLFYYAMEYLSGIDLDQLARQFGPQPEGRVIHILSQLCGSLAEAHRIGLIHRDVKPANVVLTRRGGLLDFVKVLDFGLVKAVHFKSSERTGPNAVVGTPHFISPEAVETPSRVDYRSDLYSLGAVGYWLLTGKTMFEMPDVDELLQQQVKAVPLSPTLRLGRPVSSDLEELLMCCLRKNPAERPSSAEAIDHALGQCASAGAWTMVEAQQWWKAHQAAFDFVPSTTMAEKTLVIEQATRNAVFSRTPVSR